MLVHIEKYELATHHQHGFTAGRSCFTNLLETLEAWTEAYDAGHDVNIIFLDYQKVFSRTKGY